MLTRGWRHVAWTACLLLLTAVAWADSLRVLALQHADAEVLAAYLGALRADPEALTQSLTDRFIAATVDKAVRRAEGQEARWEVATAASLVPGETGGPLASYLSGLVAAPLALPHENALVVRGTAEALDRVAELVRLLDRPTPMVAVEVRLVGAMATSQDDWNAVPDLMTGSTDIATGDPTTAGRRARWGAMVGEIVVADDHLRDRSRELANARVTTLSGVPAYLFAGQALPVFQTRFTYDASGRRTTETDVRAVFVGLELMVAPRVIGNDSVLMRLRPALTNWAGDVPGPEYGSYPVTRRVLAETVVRVRSGESLALGNWERAAEEVLRPGALGAGLSARTDNVTMVVTPVVIHEPQTTPGVGEWP